MSSRTLRQRTLLSGTMLVAAVVGYGRRAYAACVNLGGTTYCSGAETTTQTITANNAAVSTFAPFSVDAAGGNGITITGDGAISYTDTHASPLTAPNGVALSVVSTGDDAGTSTPGSVTIDTNGALNGSSGIFAKNQGSGALAVTANGNVTAAAVSGIGIDAYNSAAGSDLSVTTGPGTTVSGGSSGITALNVGAGTLTIIANGDVTGTAADGIYADIAGLGTDLSVTTGAATTVNSSTGIFAKNQGSGTLTINAAGNVTGTNGAGIYARNDGTDLRVTTGSTVSGTSMGIKAVNAGTGALTINTNGNVTATSGNGIYARNYGTDLSVTTGASSMVSGSGAGISAVNTGSGALTITANGDVTGHNNDGIIAYSSNTDTNLSVTTAAGTTVSGATGIVAFNHRGTGSSDTGTLIITANGNVTGTGGKGIYARAYGSDLSVTTGVGTTVSGTTGIEARNATGAVTVTANGDVTGTLGINARAYGTGVLTVTANGDVTGTTNDGIYALNYRAGTVTTGATTTVSGATGIFARGKGSGALTITANGDVTGTIGDGITAYNAQAGDLGVTTGPGTVSGARFGILARDQGGAVTITANGDVTGAHGGIYAQSGASPITITVAATSTVTSAVPGTYAIETEGGPATVTVAGTVAGAMKIGGTLAFQSGATYKVFVTPATASLATVSGTATLAGTVNASFAAGSYMQKQYTIVTAAGGLGGTTFSSLSTANLPAGFLANLSYDDDDVFLNLSLSLATLSTAGLNENQGNVATAINTFFNNGGGLPPGFVTLVGQTGTAHGNGLSQLSGEVGADTTQASFDAMDAFMSVLLDPFNNGHLGAGSTDGGALGYAGDANEKASQAYAAVTPRDRKAMPFATRWNVWASGYGGSSTVNGNAATGSHDTTSRIYGAAAGADYRLSPDTVLGFALGGAGFNFGLTDGLGSGRADLFQAGLYGRHFIGNAYIAGALAYGWQDVTTDRTVTVAGTDKLEAEFHPQTIAARMEGGYRFATPWLGVTPYGALQVTSFHLPAYAESATSGSNQFALSYASQTTTDWRTELGTRLDKSFLVADGLFTLRGRLAWAHDSNTDRPVSAAFQTLPGASFTVNGAEPAADGVLVSAGAQMHWGNGFSLAGSFEGEFSGTTQSYAGKGTLRYTFH